MAARRHEVDLDIRYQPIIIVYLSAFLAAVGASTELCHTIGSKYYCYYTNDSVLSWAAAAKFCTDRGSGLPVIKDQNTQSSLEKFLADSTLPTGSVWIGAKTVPVDDSVPWHWINGRNSSLRPNERKETTPKNWCSSLRSEGNKLIQDQNWWTDSPPWYICLHENNSAECASNLSFQYKSGCYKAYQEIAFIHNEPDNQNTDYIRWFTAVNRCAEKNATLAVFDDDFMTNLPPTSLPWLSATGDGACYKQAWIGLIRSWWIWTDNVDVLFNKFNPSNGRNAAPPTSPPVDPNSGKYCAAANRSQWLVYNCDESHTVVCLAVTPVTTTTSTSTPASTSITSTAITATSTTTRRATKAESNNSRPIAVGLGVGLGVGLTVITLVVVICCVFWRRQKHRQARACASSAVVSLEFTPQWPHRPSHDSPTEYADTNNKPQDVVYADIVRDINTPSANNNAIYSNTSSDMRRPTERGGDVIYADLSDDANQTEVPSVNKKWQ